MKRKRFQDSLLTLAAWAFEFGAFIVRLLPPSARAPLAGFWGQLFGKISKKMREALQENLSYILHTPPSHLHRLTNKIFQNFGLTLLDFFFPENVTIDVPNRNVLEQFRNKGTGVMVLTFHMGNWELGARTMQKWGWPVTAVYQPYRNKKFKKVIESRRAPGVHFIPVGGNAANGVREALRRGDMVAMLGDHPFGEEGTPVYLLGHHVMWPKGPVLLAVREKKPIVVSIIVRTGPHHYKAIVEEPLIPESKTKHEVERLVQAVADKFGKLVTQFPDQWYRFRPFEFTEPRSKEKKSKSSSKSELAQHHGV